MTSRSEYERAKVFASNSPLRNHSLNQRSLKDSLHGEERLQSQRNIERKSSSSLDSEQVQHSEEIGTTPDGNLLIVDADGRIQEYTILIGKNNSVTLSPVLW